MRLTRVYVRFFKSFNFDYERRANEKAQRAAWETLPEGWYPHVRLDVDPQITAIVGANESGKSHLLDAIECVMGVREVSRSHFCRYSQLFSVETDEVRIPDVGAVFTVTRSAESEVLTTLDVSRAVGQTFLFMRPGQG
ncbi:ATP-binding protein, partial [Rhizomonospora bruguierae]|uniref:ATP-binding protein n=1 Tax=Rhizomonospora bruguierae TaxID=1581705 RepID=UPI001BD1052C